jgi:hypothetical protein
LKDLYHVVVALKNVSGFKWDEDNGVNVNEDTLPVWKAYVEVSITFFLLMLLILLIQRYLKAARFKNKGWPHYDIMQSIILLQSCTKGTNVFHPMQGTLSDVLGLPTIENNGNEDEGEMGGDNFDWPPSDEETSCINFRSISMPVTLPTHLAMPFPSSYPAMPIPSAIHKQKFSALAASGSPFFSTSTSPSSTPSPSAKRCHISKILPDHDPEDIVMGEHMDNFTEAFHVATGTASTGVEVSPICKL